MRRKVSDDDYRDKRKEDTPPRISPLSRQYEFPSKLYGLLQDMDGIGGSPEVISWMPSGDCFRIHDTRKFVSEVLPKYWGADIKYKSFIRNINLYTFQREKDTNSPEYGAYRHKLFRRGEFELVLQMTRPTARQLLSYQKEKKNQHEDGNMIVSLSKEVCSPLLLAPPSTSVKPRSSVVDELGMLASEHQEEEQEIKAKCRFLPPSSTPTSRREGSLSPVAPPRTNTTSIISTPLVVKGSLLESFVLLDKEVTETPQNSTPGMVSVSSSMSSLATGKTSSSTEYGCASLSHEPNYVVVPNLRCCLGCGDEDDEEEDDLFKELLQDLVPPPRMGDEMAFLPSSTNEWLSMIVADDLESDEQAGEVNFSSHSKRSGDAAEQESCVGLFNPPPSSHPAPFLLYGAMMDEEEKTSARTSNIRAFTPTMTRRKNKSGMRGAKDEIYFISSFSDAPHQEEQKCDFPAIIPFSSNKQNEVSNPRPLVRPQLYKVAPSGIPAAMCIIPPKSTLQYSSSTRTATTFQHPHGENPFTSIQQGSQLKPNYYAKPIVHQPALLAGGYGCCFSQDAQGGVQEDPLYQYEQHNNLAVALLVLPHQHDRCHGLRGANAQQPPQCQEGGIIGGTFFAGAGRSTTKNPELLHHHF